LNISLRGKKFSYFDSVFIPIAIVASFFVSRFYYLTLLPIFTDEAVYLHWAKMAGQDSANFWISLLIDNKKPLQVWLSTINFYFFSDPLFAGRAVSVFAGGLSLIGLFQIGKALHSRHLGWFLAFLYIISPYHLFFDRLAHESSLLNACFIWTIWQTIKLFEKNRIPKLKDYVFLSFLMGIGFLTLATSLLFSFLPLVLKVFFYKDENGPKWKHLIFCYVGGLFWMAFPYLVIFLTHDNNPIQNIIIPNTHGQGKQGIENLLLGIPKKAITHLPGITKYFTTYLAGPIFVLSALYLVIRFKKADRNDVILLTYFCLPCVALAGTAGTGFSRYYLFCATPLIIFAGMACVWIWAWFREHKFKNPIALLLTIILATALFPAIKFNFQIISEPDKAPLISSDHSQFVESIYSGYGVPEAVKFFREKSKHQKITVLTSSNWGSPANAIFVYLMDNPNIRLIQAFWIFERGILEPQIKTLPSYEFFTGKHLEQVNISDLGELYLIKRTSTSFLNEPFIWANPNFEVAKAFPKPGMENFIVIYKLKKNTG
jgi:4-amino-4-deoxy-L-arabinose transferase-like glycosyltransferase